MANIILFLFTSPSTDTEDEEEHHLGRTQLNSPPRLRHLPDLARFEMEAKRTPTHKNGVRRGRLNHSESESVGRSVDGGLSILPHRSTTDDSFLRSVER